MMNFTKEMVMGANFETEEILIKKEMVRMNFDPEEILKEKGDISTIKPKKKTNKRKVVAFVDEKEERRRDRTRKAEDKAKRRKVNQNTILTNS